jgi:hypothetical protein
MQARFKKVSTLATCSKLEATTWIVRLSSANFNNNGWYSCNTHKNPNMGLHIVQDLRTFYFHDPPKFSHFQIFLESWKNICKMII